MSTEVMTFNHINIFIFPNIKRGVGKNCTLNPLSGFAVLPNSCNAFVNLQTSLFCQLIVLRELFCSTALWPRWKCSLLPSHNYSTWFLTWNNFVRFILILLCHLQRSTKGESMFFFLICRTHVLRLVFNY